MITQRVSSVIVLASLLLSLLLTILPLPNQVAAVRPALYPATVLFWVLSAPAGFGLVAAWCCGVVLDVFYGTPLAEHGLALAVAGYLVLKLRTIFAALGLPQQALLILPVFGSYEFVLFWVDGAAGIEVDQWWRWLPVLTTAVIWPIWSLALERIAEIQV